MMTARDSSLAPRRSLRTTQLGDRRALGDNSPTTGSPPCNTAINTVSDRSLSSKELVELPLVECVGSSVVRQVRAIVFYVTPPDRVLVQRPGEAWAVGDPDPLTQPSQLHQYWRTSD